jgi:hypothetical protein
MKILFFGDITGKSGRNAIGQILPALKQKEKPDFVVANIENAAHGKGVTPKVINSLLEKGIDFFTSGNHIFAKQAVEQVFAEYPDRIIRPDNFPAELPGSGHKVIDVGGIPVLMLNLNGQVFMEQQFDEGEISNPFRRLEELLADFGDRAQVKILDFHAEATSEKRAMGFFADGRVSAVLGTHTHVQSADAQILSKGTGYLSDLGMVGARDSVIGAEAGGIVERFLGGEDSENAGKIKVDESDSYEVGYCILEIDEQSGKCKNITSRLEYL